MCGDEALLIMVICGEPEPYERVNRDKWLPAFQARTTRAVSARVLVSRLEGGIFDVFEEETGALLPTPPPTLRAQDGCGLSPQLSSLLQLIVLLDRLPSVLPGEPPNSKPSHGESPDANVFLHITDQVYLSQVCQVTAAKLSARLSVPPPRPRSPTGWQQRRSHNH